MMARNHIPLAMSTWWVYALGTDAPIEVHGSMAAAIGGLLPDLDHPESVLGRRLKLLSLPLSALCGHRGTTHSLIAVIALLGALSGLATFPAGQHLDSVIAPLIIGYLSHLFGDSLTPSGIPLFWPAKKTYSFNLFKTKSWQETAVVGTLTLGVFFVGGVFDAAITHFQTQWSGFVSSVGTSL